MLRHAIKGHVPLIRCTSDDLIHVDYLMHQTFHEYTVGKVGSKGTYQVQYQIGDCKTPEAMRDLYLDAEENEYTVILINAEPAPELLECGELLPDKNLVYDFLVDNIPKSFAEEATEYLIGLSYQSLKQVVSLCPVYYKKITIASLRATKNKLGTQQVGVIPVNVKTDFYFDVGFELRTWINTNKDYMFADVDSRLVPKGMLLHGEAGTGKTELARHMAREWSIPLFLLDINSMLSKWQGEAEQHLNKALHTFDAESPCIVLFDEVEKLFNNTSENDTSQRLLSRILWWLQLRESKVFVIMTCNDMKAIPPELYREGRISAVFEMKGVSRVDVNTFITLLLNSFGIDKKIQINKALKTINTGKAKTIPHAKLNQMVIDYLQQTKHGI